MTKAGKPLTPPLAPADHPLVRTPEEWTEVLGAWGEPRYRGPQVFRWIHQRGVTDPAAMTDLPKSLRERLAGEGSLAPVLSVSSSHLSEDGTRKLLLSMADARTVESVLIPMSSSRAEGSFSAASDDDESEPVPEGDAPASWVTQCISSQVGCAMGCVFCASGIAGLKRHMTAAEIVSQVFVGKQEVAGGERIRNDDSSAPPSASSRPQAEPAPVRELPAEHSRIRNVVFMGMGEPLANYDAVSRALVLLTHPEGLGLSRRRVTVSTSGLVPEIDRLGRDFGGQVQLAVSLHAPTDAQRSSIMPINKKYPLAELLAALERYPLPKRRRITIEYTLIAGVNASRADALELARILRRVPSKVNLIPMNAVAENPLGAPDWDVVDAFQEALRERGVPSFVRRRKGDDIAAACGQLALQGEKKKIRVQLPVT
ncbi:MAG: 23S rRNA (adenine(2503)-C(2))-methyltransferase RlmN [Sandaracinus sp.]